jgi:sugar lactone lactonase YvrE
MACVTDTPAGVDAGDGATPNDSGAADAIDGAMCAPNDHQCDAKNCGAPNHDCLGGACVAGQCQMVTLAMGESHPLRITTDANFVYWNDLGTGMSDGAIMRVAKDGTNLKAIASSQSTPTYLFLSGSEVYWINNGTGALLDGTIVHAPVGGGSIITMYTNVAGAPSIATDGANLYWHGGGGLFSGPLSATNGSPAPVLVGMTPAGLSGGIALDPTRIFYGYFTDNTPLRWIAKNAVDGGSTLIGVERAPTGMLTVPDAGALYWAAFAGSTVRRMPLASLDAGTIAANQAGPVTCAADDKFVYWTTSQQVARMALDGTGPVTIVASHPKPGLFGVAVDDKAIYFTHQTEGTVLKIAKP